MKNKLYIAVLIAILSACDDVHTSSDTKILKHNQQFVDNEYYQVVIDSGSSSSRIYIYNIKMGKNGKLPIINSVFETKNKVPIATNGHSIQPLLDEAKLFFKEKNIPFHDIKINVLATEGMRVLTNEEQRNIYHNVALTIQQAGLQVGEIRTITGQEEAIFSWLDVNYLANAFDSGITYGILEIGGASAQISFVPDNKELANTKIININNKDYSIYSLSFSNLGIDQINKKIRSDSYSSTCYPSGYTEDRIDGKFNFKQCTETYGNIINKEKYSELLNINKVPGFYNTNFIAVGNGIYKTLSDFKLNNMLDPIPLNVNIDNICKMNYSDIKNTFMLKINAEDQCANSVYIYNILYNFLGFNSTMLTTRDSINNTKITWTLGYVLLNAH